ncbi:Phosphoglucosamine mutase [compost metagenome]
MSNFGFYKATAKLNLNTAKTAVGDRYVMAEMIRGGYNLGGEQSGHVIFLDYNTTGDGILTGIQLVDTMKASGKKLSELKKVMKQYPQVLVNVRVQDKRNYEGNVEIDKAVKAVEEKLGDNGRVLVRASGTESLIRVMAEGPDLAELEQLVGDIVAVVERELV